MNDRAVINFNYFPAKILLFGEYGIVVGGSGLAIPYPKFGGVLKNEEDLLKHEQQTLSNQSIWQLFNFLINNNSDYTFLDLLRMEFDLSQGLWFDSNIPNSYGLGSSGALVAALYSKYRTNNATDLLTAKSNLAAIERFFHGSSSGIDPAVAYFQQPLIINEEKELVLLPDWKLDHSGLSIFLVNTGSASKTISLVDWFKAQMLKPTFSRYAKSDFIEVNQKIVASVANSQKIDFNDVLAISHYQIDYFTPMIPEAFRSHYFAGLENRSFAFKLCGSGGGGYMLCFAKNNEVENYLNNNYLLFEKVC